MKQKNSIDEVYSLILEEIFTGSLKPGEVVTEAYIAEKYGISRTPVREVLNRFQYEGLINTSNRTKRINFLSVHDIEEIFEMKELIEGNVAKKAAENLTDKQSDELGQIVKKMKKLSEVGLENEAEGNKLLKNWLILDTQFHDVLFTAANNNRAHQFILRINLQWHRVKVGLVAIEGRIDRSILEHEAIGNAIMERDPDKARKMMVDHLADLKKVILKLMNAFNYTN